MRHLRHTALATLAVALCAAPPAAAHDPHKDRGRAIVSPTTGQLLGEYWAQIYSLFASEDPFGENGNPCMTVAPRVLQEAGSGFTCTVEQGTAFTTSMGTACSSVEPPPDFGADETAQRACALASDQAFLRELRLSVDGGDPIDIHQRRFERFSPQRSVQIPEDSLLGLPPGPATLTAHGWGAVVRNLGVGEHTVTLNAVFGDGGSESFPHYINVVPRSHSDEGHGH